MSDARRELTAEEQEQANKIAMASWLISRSYGSNRDEQTLEEKIRGKGGPAEIVAILEDKANAVIAKTAKDLWQVEQKEVAERRKKAIEVENAKAEKDLNEMKEEIKLVKDKPDNDASSNELILKAAVMKKVIEGNLDKFLEDEGNKALVKAVWKEKQVVKEFIDSERAFADDMDKLYTLIDRAIKTEEGSKLDEKTVLILKSYRDSAKALGKESNPLLRALEDNQLSFNQKKETLLTSLVSTEMQSHLKNLVLLSQANKPINDIFKATPLVEIFAEVVEHNSDIFKGLGAQAYAIKPVQRGLKYKDLLTELAKVTPQQSIDGITETPDYRRTVAAKSSMETLGIALNNFDPIPQKLILPLFSLNAAIVKKLAGATSEQDKQAFEGLRNEMLELIPKKDHFYNKALEQTEVQKEIDKANAEEPKKAADEKRAPRTNDQIIKAVLEEQQKLVKKAEKKSIIRIANDIKKLKAKVLIPNIAPSLLDDPAIVETLNNRQTTPEKIEYLENKGVTVSVGIDYFTKRRLIANMEDYPEKIEFIENLSAKTLEFKAFERTLDAEADKHPLAKDIKKDIKDISQRFEDIWSPAVEEYKEKNLEPHYDSFGFDLAKLGTTINDIKRHDIDIARLEKLKDNLAEMAINTKDNPLNAHNAEKYKKSYNKLMEDIVADITAHKKERDRLLDNLPGQEANLRKKYQLALIGAEKKKTVAILNDILKEDDVKANSLGNVETVTITWPKPETASMQETLNKYQTAATLIDSRLKAQAELSNQMTKRLDENIAKYSKSAVTGKDRQPSDLVKNTCTDYIAYLQKQSSALTKEIRRDMRKMVKDNYKQVLKDTSATWPKDASSIDAQVKILRDACDMVLSLASTQKAFQGAFKGKSRTYPIKEEGYVALNDVLRNPKVSEENLRVLRGTREFKKLPGTIQSKLMKMEGVSLITRIAIRLGLFGGKKNYQPVNSFEMHDLSGRRVPPEKNTGPELPPRPPMPPGKLGNGGIGHH